MGELISSLPPEILGEIFSWCSPTYADQAPLSPKSPLLLSHVCRRWRDVAISTPRIWTYAKLCVYEQSLDDTIQLMEIWLKHAKSRPLFIDIDFVDETGTHGSVIHLFNELIAVGRRYRPVLSLTDESLETHVETTNSGAFPALEEWYFWSIGCAPSEPYASGRTPMKIRALRISLTPFELVPYTSLGGSLTFLDLRVFDDYLNLTVEECAIVLSSFPQLVHCALLVDYSDNTFTGTITLQHLTSFSLSWAALVDVGPLLDCLITPALQELELSGILPETATENWDHMYKFLLRGLPPLTHLIMETMDCFYVSLLACLTLCPLIEGVWMEDCILDDSIVKGLCGGVTSTLKRLAFLSCYDITMDCLVASLKAMKDSRSGLPLEKLHVVNCGHIQTKHLSALQELDVSEVEVAPVEADMQTS